MKYSKTQNTNTKQCEKTECLLIEIYKHHSKPFTYIVSNSHTMLGELVEDDIQNFLDSKDLNKFYAKNQSKFLVPVNKLISI